MNTPYTCSRCHEPVPAPKPGEIKDCPVCHATLIGDPTATDLEMWADETAGKPLPRTAAQGIADMSARIEQLSARKKKLLDRLQDGAAADDSGWDGIAGLNQKLKEATERLAEYQAQNQGQN